MNQNFNQGFAGTGMFQGNFSGTDAGHVRQQNQQSYQYGPNGGGQQQQYISHQPASTGQFQSGQFVGGPQAAFQHGFAGTDAQHVRQQNQQSAQYGGFNGGQQSYYSQPMSQQFQGGQFMSNPQTSYQPGFTGTNVQHVRQQNQQSAQHYGGGFSGGQHQLYMNQQPMNTKYQSGHFTGGPQASFQPGFAGTDTQHVRQQNQQSAQYGGYTGNQQPFGGSQFGQGNYYGQQH